MMTEEQQALHEQHKERFTEYLAEQGLKKTAERYFILQAIFEVDNHFNVEMLQERLEENRQRVSRASIYNTIQLLLEARLVVRHQFATQQVEYELRSVAEMHHHACCSYCGAVIEIPRTQACRGVEQLRIRKFTHEYHSLYIFGMCSKCKFKQKMNKIKSKQTIKK